MKKNFFQVKKAALALFSILMPLLASAETISIDGISYNLVSKTKQAEVNSGWGSDSGDIYIPATITYNNEEYWVTSIKEWAFAHSDNLTSITIPNSITSIGDWAFHGCNGLTSVFINSIESWCEIDFGTYSSNPLYYAHDLYVNGELLKELVISKGVTKIGNYTFLGCRRNLLSIVVEEGNNIYDSRNDCNAIVEKESNTLIVGCSSTIIPENVTSLGEYAFFGCSGLETLLIPATTSSIGNNAFTGCTRLKGLILADGIETLHIGIETRFEPVTGEYINNGIWKSCPLEILHLGRNLEYDEYSPFSRKETLFNVQIGDNVTVIGDKLFKSCNSLTSITIPKRVTYIGYQAFKDCNSLESISIPEGVDNIAAEMFSGCSNLTNITIPENVESIWNSAFLNCNKLTTIVLPKSIKHIAYNTFANCPELLNVYCYAESVPSTDVNAFNNSYPDYATLHVPTNSLKDYVAATPWSSFGTIVSLGAAITRIALDKTSATLTEGEELTLTITTTPDDADMALISWSSSAPSVASVDAQGKVTAIAKGTATITAIANDGSGVSASCEIVVNELILGKCATPTISYEDGEVIFACDTEGVAFISETKETNGNIVGKRQDEVFSLFPTYTITAYATKAKYENSDEATLTLCWIPCTEEHESEETSILTIPSKPVLISTQGGTITVSRLASDTTVAAYDATGTQLATATATAGTATLITNLTTGDIAIVKIGGYSIKIAIK